MTLNVLLELPLLIAALISVYLGSLVVRRPAPGAHALLVMLLAAGFWAASYALELRLPTLEGKLFAAKIQYFGIAPLVVAWFVFTVQYTRRECWIVATPAGRLLLSIIPACAVILVLTNEQHGLIWISERIDPSAPINALVFTHGPGFWLLIGYDYLLVAVGTLLLVRVAVRAKGVVRGQAITLFAGILPVWLANAAYVMEWGPVAWLDPTPFAMALTGMVYAWSLLHLHLLDIVPLAHAEIFDFIDDAIVVVDMEGRIADANPAAQRLALNPQQSLVSKSLDALLGDEAARMSTTALAGDAPLEDICLLRNGAEYTFALRVSPLYEADSHPAGYVCVLRDVTKRKLAEDALLHLTHHLEQVVLERTSELHAESNERQRAMAALAASEARNWAILETIPDLIVHVQRTHAEPAALYSQAIGTTRNADLLRQRSLDQLLPPDVGDLLARAGERLQSGYVESVAYEVEVDADKGTDVLTLEARIVAIDADDQFLLIIRDMTAQRRAEQQLRYQADLLENVSDAVISVDRSLRIVSWNNAAAHIYGYQFAEVQGRLFSEALATTFVQSTPKEVAELLEATGRWEGEALQQCKDGSSIAVWASVSLVQDAAGRNLGVVAVNRDMSGIRKMQHELQQSEARYRDILESTGEMIFSTDAAGRFLFVNRSWREVLGYTDDQVQELRVENIIHPDERQRIRRLFRRLSAGEGPLPVNTLLYTSQGQPLFVEGLSTAVFEAGEFMAAHTFLRDVTRRVQAEAAQQAAEQRYRSLFEDAPVMYVIAQVHQGTLTIADCNALFVETLGYSREDLLDKSLRNLLAPGSQGCLDLDTRPHAANRLLGGEECEVLTKDGRVLETLLRMRYERDEAGHVCGLRAMFVDISDRKRMERQLRETSDQLHALSRHLVTVREEEQSRIAREIHDELGQTLTVLKMDVSWLASRAQRCGDDIPRKLASMNELLGATLQTVQRIATELRPALLDNLGLVAAIQWLARKYEERTGIVCTFVHSNKDGAAVDKDLETALFRIIQEALTNAARHADPRSVQICLQVKPAEILLQIEDDGSGIAPTQTNGEQSFGLLGMRERLYAWNGHLTITSAPGQGTALHIVVPRPG